jgi:hypothetical protein
MQQTITTFEEQFQASFPKQGSGLLVSSSLPSKQRAAARSDQSCDHSYEQARAILSGEWRIVQELLMQERKVLSAATTRTGRG